MKRINEHQKYQPQKHNNAKQMHHQQHSEYNKNNQIIKIPNFKLYNIGKGIDNAEYYTIVNSANEALKVRENPLSSGVIKRIKSKIKGEWMIVASVKGLKGFDFTISKVTGSDFLSFSIDKFHFQVCRIQN